MPSRRPRRGCSRSASTRPSTTHDPAGHRRRRRGNYSEAATAAALSRSTANSATRCRTSTSSGTARWPARTPKSTWRFASTAFPAPPGELHDARPRGGGCVAAALRLGPCDPVDDHTDRGDSRRLRVARLRRLPACLPPASGAHAPHRTVRDAPAGHAGEAADSSPLRRCPMTSGDDPTDGSSVRKMSWRWPGSRCRCGPSCSSPASAGLIIGIACASSARLARWASRDPDRPTRHASHHQQPIAGEATGLRRPVAREPRRHLVGTPVRAQLCRRARRVRR